MLPKQLEKAWRDYRALVPLDVVMRFTEKGLVLGADTVLAPLASSESETSIVSTDARLVALLSVAHLRPVQPAELGHIRKAAEQWKQGDESIRSRAPRAEPNRAPRGA